MENIPQEKHSLSGLENGELVEKLELIDSLYGKKDNDLIRLEKELAQSKGDIQKMNDIRRGIAKTIILHTDLKKIGEKPDGLYHMELRNWKLTFEIEETSQKRAATGSIASKETFGKVSFKDLPLEFRTAVERDAYEAAKKINRLKPLYPGSPKFELQDMEKEFNATKDIHSKNELRQKIAQHVLQNLDTENISAMIIKNDGTKEINLNRWRISFSFKRYGDSLLITNISIEDRQKPINVFLLQKAEYLLLIPPQQTHNAS